MNICWNDKEVEQPMRDRAVILAIQRNRATVMLPGGEFRTISVKNQAIGIGQEIWLPPARRHIWGTGMATLTAAVLAVFLLFSQALSPVVPTAIGIVSVDINPSINLVVGPNARVLAATGFDQAGKYILSQFNPTTEPVATVVVHITALAVADHYVNRNAAVVVIGGVFNQTTPAWFSAVVRQEKNAVHLHRWPLTVALVDKSGHRLVTPMSHMAMSVGRYLLWQNDKASHPDWSRGTAQSIGVDQLLHNESSVTGHSGAEPASGIGTSHSSNAVQTHHHSATTDSPGLNSLPAATSHASAPKRADRTPFSEETPRTKSPQKI